jgi:hypothetical protein
MAAMEITNNANVKSDDRSCLGFPARLLGANVAYTKEYE